MLWTHSKKKVEHCLAPKALRRRMQVTKKWCFDFLDGAIKKKTPSVYRSLGVVFVGDKVSRVSKSSLTQ
jgi:hypothetical protein